MTHEDYREMVEQAGSTPGDYTVDNWYAAGYYYGSQTSPSYTPENFLRNIKKDTDESLKEAWIMGWKDAVGEASLT